VVGVGGIIIYPQNAPEALAWLYDSTGQTVTTLGSQAHQGAFAAADVLTSGQALVTGGVLAELANGNTVSSAADLYDPTTNTWTSTGAMASARAQHTATALPVGSLVVAGGTSSSGPGASVLSSAEIYSPTTSAWSSAGNMATARYLHTASLLASGDILVVGGSDSTNTSCSCTTFIATSELYDSSSNSWSVSGSLNTPRYAHTATLLQNGQVLVTGGFGGTPSTLQNTGTVLASAELYDPASGTWTTVASMNTPRMNHTASLLSSGQVLVTGGETGSGTTATAEIYDPVANTWTLVASLSVARQYQLASVLPSGDVLVVGGLNDASSTTFGVGSAELYDPGTNTWSAAGSLVTPRQHFVLLQLSTGVSMVVGGAPNLAGLPEFYE
jgi:N-acetylneuraminic acid mutarotase